MKTDFLRRIGINDQQIKAIMAENGKDIQAEKQRNASELQRLSESLTELESLRKHKEEFSRERFEALCDKASDCSEKLAEVQKAQALSSSRKALENRFFKAVGEREFVNTYTKNALKDAFCRLAEENKGLSDAVLMEGLLSDAGTVFRCAHPVLEIPATVYSCAKLEDAEIRSVMGLS